MTIPRITHTHPAAGVEGGRIQVFGERLTGGSEHRPALYFDTMPCRPLIASPTRIIAPIPEGAPAGRLRLAWSDGETTGPHVEVAERLADELNPVANPAVDSTGAIFSTFSAPRGQEAPNGVSVFRIAPEGGAEPYLSNLMNPSGLAFDASGTLFISCRNDGTVRRVTEPGATEIFADGLGTATGIAFDRAGTLFVGDRGGGVYAVEPKGSVRRFAKLPPSVAAYHLAFGPDDALYVTAPTLSNDDPVFRIDEHGQITRVVEHLARPQGLAFDDQGRLHVVAIRAGERGIHRASTGCEARLVVAGENLVGLAFDGQGRMVVASTNAIYRLNEKLE